MKLWEALLMSCVIVAVFSAVAISLALVAMWNTVAVAVAATVLLVAAITIVIWVGAQQ